MDILEVLISLSYAYFVKIIAFANWNTVLTLRYGLILSLQLPYLREEKVQNLSNDHFKIIQILFQPYYLLILFREHGFKILFWI